MRVVRSRNLRNENELRTIDEAMACCDNIATISGLLGAAELDPLEPKLAKNAGLVIEREARHLLELLRRLGK